MGDEHDDHGHDGEGHESPTPPQPTPIVPPGPGPAIPPPAEPLTAPRPAYSAKYTVVSVGNVIELRAIEDPTEVVTLNASRVDAGRFRAGNEAYIDVTLA
jgi:hypothetical protein